MNEHRPGSNYRPHTLTAHVDSGGVVTLALVCPYTTNDDPYQPCRTGVEAPGCLWKLWEYGDHHPSCPAHNLRDAACSAGDATTAAAPGCWGDVVPEECDGFESNEIGHCHTVVGCFARDLIGEWGWEEATRWHPRLERDLTLPALVHVHCDEDDGVLLSAVEERYE